MTFYFAYGSNLNTNQMKQRCPSSKPLDIGCLKGYRLDFTHRSSGWAGGVADIVEDQNSEVWGLIYEVSMEDLYQLDDYEGYPDVYTRFQTSVKTKSGKTLKVWVYTVVQKEDFIPPTKEYMKLILEAAEKYVFPNTYLSYLKTIETI